MTDRSIFLFEINKNNLQSDLYICFFCVCVPFLWRIWLYAFTLLFLLFIIASIIQNISGLKPIPFSLLFHDLKVVVNMVWLFVHTKSFYCGNLLFNWFMNFTYNVFLSFIIASIMQNMSGLKPIPLLCSSTT